MSNTPPPGWYPNGEHWETWWDGLAWTEHHREVAPHAYAAPAALEGSGITIQRTDDGLVLVGTNWMGRSSIGGAERQIPFVELLTVEMLASGVRLRDGRWGLTISIPKERLGEAKAFVDEVLRQHYARTGRSIGSGEKLSRSDRAEAMSSGFDQALVGRLTPLRAALEAGDITAQTAAEWDLATWVRTQGVKKWKDRLEAEVGALRSQLGLPLLNQVGYVGDIGLYEDRVVRGREGHAIDAFTEAQVFLDGQKQVTTRPSAFAAAFGAFLPGSALVPALLMQEKETTDLRRAHFIVGSIGWSFGTGVQPNSVPVIRELAQRVNAVASAAQERSSFATATAAGGAPGDIVSQLNGIAELERTGVISPEQAETLKARIIGG